MMEFLFSILNVVGFVVMGWYIYDTNKKLLHLEARASASEFVLLQVAMKLTEISKVKVDELVPSDQG